MGFPIEVTALKDTVGGAVISGSFVNLNGNNQFSVPPSGKLSFNDLMIVPGSLKNPQGIPYASVPASRLPVVTDENYLALIAAGTVQAAVEDKKIGINLYKEEGGKDYGVIKGEVKLLNQSYSQSGVISFPHDIYLQDLNTHSNIIPVLNADNTVSDPANAPNGFAISDSLGHALNFSLQGFPSVTANLSSTYKKGTINLNAGINTNISGLNPPNLAINFSNVQLTPSTTNPFSAVTTPVTFSLGQWGLSCNNWTFDQTGLKLLTTSVNTLPNGGGLTVPIKNLYITANSFNTNQATADFSNLMLLGIQPVTVDPPKGGGIGQVQVGAGKVWQISNASGSTGTISNLPALNPTDKISLSNIFLRSNGDNELTMVANPVVLKNCLKFTPYPSPITLQPGQFAIPGNYALNLPVPGGPMQCQASLAYSKSGSNLQFAFLPGTAINFTQSGLTNSFMNNPTLTDRLLTVKGWSKEDGVFPKINTTLYYGPDSVSVWIDPGQDIVMMPAGNASQPKLAQVFGGMRVQGANWNTFWFTGTMANMTGLSNAGGGAQQMTFKVNGAIEADGQSLSVQNIDAGPFKGMTWTYDFPNSRLTGFCDLDLPLGGIEITGTIASTVDPTGWFFLAKAGCTLPGLGGANVTALLGNYPTFPSNSNMATTLGDITCLPTQFQNQVQGFLISATVARQLVPDENVDLGFAEADWGCDLSLNARLYMAWANGGTTFGFGLLADANAHATGGLAVTCLTMHASADVQLGINGEYHTKDRSFFIDGCGSVSAELGGSICAGIGGGACLSPGDAGCLAASLPPLTVGANILYCSNSGFNFGLVFKPCSQVCQTPNLCGN
jgi:hypothetical protein